MKRRIRGRSEGVGNVLQALIAVQLRLRASGDNALHKIGAGGDARYQANAIGKQFALVEPPLCDSVGMEWHRHQCVKDNGMSGDVVGEGPG